MLMLLLKFWVVKKTSEDVWPAALNQQLVAAVQKHEVRLLKAVMKG
jgi:hypothetical protein